MQTDSILSLCSEIPCVKNKYTGLVAVIHPYSQKVVHPKHRSALALCAYIGISTYLRGSTGRAGQDHPTLPAVTHI